MAGSGAGAGSLWNKNSWHWEEKKYTSWAHEWLKENLVGVGVEADGVSARITKVGSVTGDAAVNVRKGKKVVMFEMTIKCAYEGKQGDDTCAGTISVFEVLPDDVRDGDYEVTVRSPSNAAPKARELMRTKGPAALKAKLTEFLAALTKRDGDARALAEDKARREEEARKAAEAEVKGAAGYAAASADVEAEERKRKEEEAKKAASAPESDAPQKIEGTGSVWNAGNYHWEEKPMHDWARTRLQELLQGWELETPGCSMRIVTMDSCLGDASISIRKGKKLVFFELTVKCGWEGEMIDGEGDIIASTDGIVQFSGLDQDNWNSPEDLEIDITCGAAGSGERRIYEIMRTKGKESIRELIATFVGELQAK